MKHILIVLGGGILYNHTVYLSCSIGFLALYAKPKPWYYRVVEIIME